MSNFTIDFFELSFLAEACIPPRPIARTMFWENLTNLYWRKMTEEERASLFEWMNRSDFYKESLKTEEKTQIFHARFDPDNQYLVIAELEGSLQEQRAFKYKDRYHVSVNTWCNPDYIKEIKKL